MAHFQKSKYGRPLRAAVAVLLSAVCAYAGFVDYTWDVSTNSGIQNGNGTWGTNNYWTVTGSGGTVLGAYPGRNNSATFDGADGTYTITISGSPECDSITFLNSGYTLSGGTSLVGSARILMGTKFGSAGSTGYEYDKATDDNSGTYFNATSASGAYTGFDLGSSGARVIVHICFYPRAGYESRMNGGKFQGSNTSSSSGYSDLYTISGNPAAGWTCVDLTPGTAYRYLRYLGPNNGYCNVAEIQFFSYSEINVASGKTATISSVRDGAYGLVKSGNGTLTLSGTNIFTGDVNITDGILQANNTKALGDAGNSITVSSGAALDVNGINLQAYTTAITINGQVDANTGAIYNSGADQQNAILKIALGSDASIGGSGGRCDIGRGLSSGYAITGNSHTLTKVGTDLLSVLYASTGLTSVVVNGGEINQEVANAFGGAPVTVNGGGILGTYNSLTLTNNITLNNKGVLQSSYSASDATTYSGTITTSGSDTLLSLGNNTVTLTGVISGTGEVVKKTTGIFILSNTGNSWSGGLTITSGTIQLGAANVIPDGAGYGDVSLSGTLDLNSHSEGINGLSGAGTVTSGVSGAVTLTVGNNDATSSFSGLIQNGSGTMSLTKAGAGTLTLSHSNTYTGVTTISGGTISVATLANGGAASNIGQAANTAGQLVINGGTLSYTGGTVSCDHLFTVGASGAAIDASGGGALTLSNSGSIAYSGSTTHLITFTGTNTAANTFTPVIGNDGSNLVSVTKSGAGTWVLSGTNTYTGVTTISGGVLSAATLANGGSNSNIGKSTNAASNLIFDGGTLKFTGASSQSTDRNFTVTGNGGGIDASGTSTYTLTVSGSSTISGGSPTFTLSGSNTSNNTLSGTLAGALSLTKSGAGRWVLSAANSYSGITTVSTGTLALGAANVIPDGSGKGDVSLAGTLDLNSYSEGINGLSGAGTVTSGVSGAVTLTAGNNDATSSFSGIIQNGSGTMSLTKAGAGTLTLSGTSTYTGVTTISSGVLSVSTLANGGSSSNIGQAANTAGQLVINGGTLSYTGGTVSCDHLLTVGASGATIDASGSGALTLSNTGSVAYSGSTTHLITFTGTNTAANTFAPVIGNDGGSAVSIAKSGAGEWVLSGNNTYTGTVSVSAGTLLVNGSCTGAGGAVTVSGTATLGGTGTVTGPVSLSSGAKLSPGSGGTGILTMSDNLTFASGATYAVQINGTTAGTNYSQSAVSGTITLGSASLSLTLGYTPVIGDAYTIIANNGSSAVVNTFLNIAEGGTITASYSGLIGTFKVSYLGGSGHDVVLTCSSVSGGTADDYTQWHYSKKVYINTKEGGANIKSDQSNFPLLVRLTSANFNFSQAQSSGQDVRFAKSTGVHFPYQIERWDNVNDLAEIWVNVDVIKGYNDSQYVLMYWGKSNAADSQSSSKVFATSNNFAGVWHLNQDPSGGSNAIKDATGNANNGTSTGSMTSSELVSAVVGKGISFTGSSSQGITVPDAPSLDITAGVTVSAWFNASSLTSYLKIAVKSFTSSMAPYDMYCLGFDNASHIRGEMGEGSTQYTVAGSTTLTTGAYYYGTFTWDGSTMKLFLNGVHEGNTTSQGGTLATDAEAFTIGMSGYAADYFTGTIDEVQLSNTARSADWIKLCYETQKTNQTTVTVQENYSDWTYSKNLYFNTKASGADVSNNVIKFPALVRLDTTNFDFTTTQDSGQDIRFAKSDGTHLYYQIEQWDNVNDAAALWVRVDTVYGNDSTHYITMYWGNNNVNSMSNGKAVFDTGNGFAGVWHLTNNDLTDASCNHNDATNYGTTDTAGVIGTARKFVDDATPDSIRVAGLVGNTSTQLTISCWAKVDSIDGGTVKSDLVSIGDNCALRVARATDGSRDSMRCNYHQGSTWNSTVQPGGAGMVLHAGWKYLTWMVNPTTTGGPSEVTYINGASVASNVYSDQITYSSGGTNTLFGKNGHSTSYFFGGVLDEIRIDKTNRSADWIKLCYQNQKPSQSLVVFTTEDYSQWTYSRKINLNTTPSGAGVATDALNFPVLLRLTSTNFTFSQARDDGSDIRFASSLGKVLPYQIERWDRNDQLAEVWVLADTVHGNNGTQYMTMYWGKTGVASRSNGTAVFDTGNGFAGVWHLGEGSGNAFDATINGITDTAKGTVKYQDTGSIAYSDSLTGTSSYLKAGDAYSTLLNMSARDKVTVSAWVNRAGNAEAGSVEGIAGKYKWASSANAREYCIGNNSSSGFAFYISTDGTSTNETSLSSGFVPTNGTWYYVTGVMDAVHMTIFVNGVQKAQANKTAISTTTTAPFKIGLIDDDGGSNKQYFNGKIDEVIVSDTNRSADWVKLCYQNQKANQTLVDFDDYSKWAYSKKIYINTASMSLNSYVTKFPLLVRLDATMINFSEPQASGQDIRFSKADGTHFYYEKEQWDTTNKKAALWVLVDTVFQNNGTQYINMYWGKSDAVDNSNGNAVFDTANGFVGVWQFGPTTGNTDTLRDATINGFTLTNASSTPATNSAIVLGRTFNGSNQRCYVNDAAALEQTGSLTLSAWINHAALPAAGAAAMGLLSKAAAEYRFTDSTLSGGGNYLYMTVGGTRYVSTAATAFATGTWYHAAASLDAAHDTLLFYENGVKLGNTVTSATGVPATGSHALNIGADQSNNWFNGSMDEVRIEKVLRNPDWINLCYNTQNPAQTATQTDTSSELFSSLGMTTTYTSGQLTAATIAAHNWTIKFDATGSGGGISWLSPDSVGSAANQLDGNSNLFTLITNNDSTSKGAATLTMLDSSNVFVRLLQQRTIGALTYWILYTVEGNGKVFIRVYVYSTTAVTPTGGLEFRIATGGASNITNYYPTATATSCNYLLHCDAASNRLDPCLVFFKTWSQATGLTGTTSGKYIGMLSSSWTMPGNRSRLWEFMLDLAHRNWNDSTGVGAYISEYSNPDSLAFYTGTPYLEKAWEDQLSGHWKFEEGSGDTAFDNSGGGNSAVRTAGSTWTWTSGKWGGGLSLCTGDSVKIVDNAAFNGGISGFTVMAWVNPAVALTGSAGIFGKFGTNGYKMTGGTNGVVQLTLNTTTFSGRTDIGTGSWHHVAAMYHKRTTPVPDTIKLFTDGKPDTIITGSNYSFDASGVNALMGPGFSGTLDDVRFYNECLTDDAIKTIYQLGYAASQGMYMVRADNNNAVNCVMRGGTYHRYFPVFQVTNFWNSGALGVNNPYVYMNGSQLTYNKDYFVMLDQNVKRLTVGFNRVIGSDGTQIYIGSDPVQAVATTTMPQMSWGSYAWPSSHFYVKNFSGNTFGSAAANQYYMDFKMDNTTAGNGGEIYRLKTSMISPCGTADTTATGNLVSLGSSTDSASFSCGKYKIGTHWLKSTADIAAAPTYTVVESSAVRVILQIDDRKLKNSTDSCNLRTWFTFYPTGQIFRWDSVYVPNSTITIDTVRYDVLEKYQASNAGTGSPSSPITNAKLRGGRYGATSLQDYAAAFLGLDTLNGATYGMEAPSVKDTARVYSNGSGAYQGIGTRFVHCSKLLNANKPYQTALYMDLHSATFTSALVDSVCKGVQNNIGNYAGRLLINGVGDTVLGSAGDFNLDGFNEREGAYVYQADATNTAHFTLLANANASGDTCRFYPALRIANYTATNVPQYVYVNSQALVRSFGYNAYLKQATRELIVQINQKFCSNADIYISSDRTLAVTMTDFRADPGDGRIKLQWNTQSEENNLGFFLYRRIRSQFLDSISRSADTASAADTAFNPSAGSLMKNKVIGFSDTAWRQVNDKIIYGATAGVSYGERKYSLMDRQVYNEVQYEYKLVAVDYNSSRETYDKYAAAVPHRVLPLRFALWGNFPNPFRRLTCLKYDLPVRTKVMINIYDIQGRLVRRLVRPDKPVNPGFYQALWDCRDDRGRFLASGPYIYRITAQGFAMSRVMVMIK